MKMILPGFGIISLFLFASGCASTGKVVLDETKRPRTASVDVFKDGRAPEQKFKEIAELSFLGPPDEELRALNRFISDAKKMGGNGILFFAVSAGPRGGVTIFQTTKWVFKGKVIVYEQSRP